MQGRIVSVICGKYNVLVNGKIISCTPRGVFRHKNMKLIVGDYVEIEENTITNIFERKNSLFRPNISNVDLGIIVMSYKNPDFSSLLLEKFITLLNMNDIKPLVILTKIDLSEDREDINKVVEMYKKISIQVIPYSKRTKEGLDEVKNAIKGKIIAFMGQTGVGKSSLINLIDENFSREIGEYSEALGRGKHKTKEVVLLPYDGGFIADTPGFSSLELPLFKEELAEYYPGAFTRLAKCKFTNCLHINEKDCEVKKAINEGIIAKETYDNYLNVLNELIFRKDRF